MPRERPLGGESCWPRTRLGSDTGIRPAQEDEGRNNPSAVGELPGGDAALPVGEAVVFKLMDGAAPHRP